MLNRLCCPRGALKYLLMGCLAAVFLLGMGLPVQASAPFYWENISVDIDLQANGDLWVTETQTYTFTATHNNQRYRYIPLDKVDDITDISVREGEVALAAETGRKNNQQWIRWSHFLHATGSRTFEIRYRVIGGIHTSSAANSLYWQAIFPDRSAPVNAAQVTVHLPEALSGQLLGFRSEGISAQYQQTDAQTHVFRADQPLQPGQLMAVKIDFPTTLLDISRPLWQQPLGNLRRAIGYGLTHPVDALSDFPNLLVDNIFVVILGGCLVGSLVSFWVSKLPRRCPRCGKWRLRVQKRTLSAATYSRDGVMEVKRTCQNCNFHDSSHRAIARLDHDDDYWSSLGGGGCGSGGSGGGGGG